LEHILQKSRKEQISFWVGEICISIGQGKIHDTLSRMIDFYQREAYERGIKAGKSEMAAMF